jgi:hypothetical protein
VSPRRLSTKHPPYLDDALKREADPLVRGTPGEARLDEDPAREGTDEDEFAATLEGTFARRELSRHLRLSVFPADKAELLREAEENGAPESLLELLGRLPEKSRFGTVYEVWTALGGKSEPAPIGRAQERESRAT